MKITAPAQRRAAVRADTSAASQARDRMMAGNCEISKVLLDNADTMTLLSGDFSLRIDAQRLPVTDLVFTTGRPEIDSSELLTSFTTTNVTIKGDLTMTPEQEEELSKWWAEIFEREMWRQIVGRNPRSEFTESLRAAGTKV